MSECKVSNYNRQIVKEWKRYGGYLSCDVTKGILYIKTDEEFKKECNELKLFSWKQICDFDYNRTKNSLMQVGYSEGYAYKKANRYNGFDPDVVKIG